MDQISIVGFKLLSDVGNALLEESNETKMNTEYVQALNSLLELEESLKNMNLDPQAEKGVKRLIKYLRIKINRRMDRANKFY